MNDDETPTTEEQLDIVETWLQSVKLSLATEIISWGELAQIEAVYETVKAFNEEQEQ